MSNEKNLIPLSARTKDEQRAIQSMGGKASGVTRGFKSALKNRAKNNPELFDEIIDALCDMALAGDLRAIDMLIDLMGESAQRELLALKRKELRLKEQESKTKNVAPDALSESLRKLAEELDAND